MPLDVPTLLYVTVVVAFVLGALLVVAGVQGGIRTLLWWGGAYLIGALGTALLSLRGLIPHVLSVDIANALIILCFATAWCGARVFERRRIRAWMLVAGPVTWLLALRLPPIGADINVRVVLGSLMMALFAILAAVELWRGREEGLRSRSLAVAVIGMLAGVFLARIPLALLQPLPSGSTTFPVLWFAIGCFASLLYMIAMAFVLLSMAKERTELAHKRAALVDPLTGLANRRGFFDEAEGLLEKLPACSPVAVLLFDLDRFKQVNDRWGHAVGDVVLRLFAASVRDNLAPADVVARLGGEEFAAVLPGVPPAAAVAAADSVRRAFAAAAEHIGERPLGATVSVGVAVGQLGADNILGLLAEADRALYRAKAAGRDRVEILEQAGAWRSHKAADSMIRDIERTAA